MPEIENVSVSQLASDAFGVKPLLYTFDEESAAPASTGKTLTAAVSRGPHAQ